MIVMPGLIDRYRNLRNGRKKYTCEILLLGGDHERQVIAHVYGNSLREARRRKRIVCKALKALHESRG